MKQGKYFDGEKEEEFIIDSKLYFHAIIEGKEACDGTRGTIEKLRASASLQ